MTGSPKRREITAAEERLVRAALRYAAARRDVERHEYAFGIGSDKPHPAEVLRLAALTERDQVARDAFWRAAKSVERERARARGKR